MAIVLRTAAKKVLTFGRRKVGTHEISLAVSARPRIQIFNHHLSQLSDPELCLPRANCPCHVATDG